MITIDKLLYADIRTVRVITHIVRLKTAPDLEPVSFKLLYSHFLVELVLSTVLTTAFFSGSCPAS